MHNRKNKIVVMALLVLSVILLSSTSTFVGASQFPILPSTPVTLSIAPLNYGQRFPFGATLSDFPSGTFSLGPGTYTCWCIDLLTDINWGTQYKTMLYSSLSPPSNLPFSQSQLNMVNYILNHKLGTGDDVQMAIWLVLGFTAAEIETRYLPVTPTAQALYADALSHGQYLPVTGEILGIICIPYLSDELEEYAQPLIIELRQPGDFEGLTPGFWKNHVNLWQGYSPTDKFADVFGVTISNNPDLTLLQALKAGGGGEAALGRQAVAALLNSAHQYIEYPLTAQQIINIVQNAVGNEQQVETLKNLLDGYNNFEGGIDAHGRPI